MSNEEPYRDQAEKLRRKVEKVDETYDDYHSLPPRSEMHRSKKKRTKLKLKYPLIRLLTVFFILLPTTIFSIYTYFDSKNNGGSEKAFVSSGYETINIEKQKKNSQSAQDNSTQKVKMNKANQQNNNSDTTAGNKSTNIKGVTGQAADKNATGSSNHSTSQSTTGINQSNDQKIVYHTVQPQETLTMIAMKYYHSKLGISTIRVENHLQDDNIRVGQVLKIPLGK